MHSIVFLIALQPVLLTEEPTWLLVTHSSSLLATYYHLISQIHPIHSFTQFCYCTVFICRAFTCSHFCKWCLAKFIRRFVLHVPQIFRSTCRSSSLHAAPSFLMPQLALLYHKLSLFIDVLHRMPIPNSITLPSQMPGSSCSVLPFFHTATLLCACQSKFFSCLS